MVWERIYLPVRIVQRSIQCAFQLTLELLSWHSPQIFDYWATVWISEFSEPAGRKESSLHLEHLFTFLGQFFYIEPFTLILLLYCFSSFLSFISGVSQRISSLYFHFYTLWCMHFFFFFIQTFWKSFCEALHSQEVVSISKMSYILVPKIVLALKKMKLFLQLQRLRQKLSLWWLQAWSKFVCTHTHTLPCYLFSLWSHLWPSLWLPSF